MSSQDLITQDMLEVLAKVQTDPRSKLFARGIKLGAPQSTEQPLTGKEPFLSAAERKLIRAHRERVEAFLYARADKALLDSAWGQRVLLNKDEPGPIVASQQSQPIVPSSLGAAARELVTGSGNPVSDLLFALLLRPSMRGRVLLSLAYMSQERYQAASEQLTVHFSSALSSSDRVLVLLNRGLLAWEKDQMVEAVSLYEQAKSILPNDFYAGSMAFVTALNSGREDLIQSTDRALIGLESSLVHKSLPDLLRICRTREILQPTAVHASTIRSELAELILDSLPTEASQ